MKHDVIVFIGRISKLPKRKAMASIRGKRTVLKRRVKSSQKDLKLFNDLVAKGMSEGAFKIRQGFKNV